MGKCPEIGLSNIQAAWVEIEDVSGVLQKPTAKGYIRPRGNISMTQTPGQSASEELSESLNVSEQFQNSVEAGEVSIPTYLRLTDDGSHMQAHAVLAAAMGKYQAADTVTAAVNEALGIDEEVAEFAIDGVTGGIFPPRGVIQIDDEKILVGNTEMTAGAVTKVMQCVRGYAGTTAAAHDDDAVITVKSAVYAQDVCRDSLSIWVKNDRVLQWGRGGYVSSTEFPLSNESGQQVNYTISFAEMGWAGPAVIKGAPSGNVITVKTLGGDNAAWGYTEGVYIQNVTKNDDNSGAGYRVTAVDRHAGTITVDGSITGWADEDEIEPWTPKSQSIGNPVESRTALVFINGYAGGIREGSFTMNTPTEYKRLIGDKYPRFSVDTQREISVTMNGYLDRDGAVAIGRGYEGYEVPVSLAFGPDEGRRLAVTLPRVKLNTPEIGVDGAAFTLDRTGTVLGRDYEDAVYITTE